jgi:hypothetical protein
MECVGYLPDRSSQALNTNARVKLYMHGAKLCICLAWFLVYLSSYGTKERCMSVGVIVRCSLFVYFISCKRFVDNKYSRNVERILKGFHFFEIFCSHPCLRKISFKDSSSMDPKMLAIKFILLFLFFLERDSFISKRPIVVVHQFFFIITQARPR